jgi:hypothetical protein
MFGCCCTGKRLWYNKHTCAGNWCGFMLDNFVWGCEDLPCGIRKTRYLKYTEWETIINGTTETVLWKREYTIDPVTCAVSITWPVEIQLWLMTCPDCVAGSDPPLISTRAARGYDGTQLGPCDSSYSDPPHFLGTIPYPMSPSEWDEFYANPCLPGISGATPYDCTSYTRTGIAGGVEMSWHWQPQYGCVAGGIEVSTKLYRRFEIEHTLQDAMDYAKANSCTDTGWIDVDLINPAWVINPEGAEKYLCGPATVPPWLNPPGIPLVVNSVDADGYLGCTPASTTPFVLEWLELCARNVKFCAHTHSDVNPPGYDAEAGTGGVRVLVDCWDNDPLDQITVTDAEKEAFTSPEQCWELVPPASELVLEEGFCEWKNYDIYINIWCCPGDSCPPVPPP